MQKQFDFENEPPVARSVTGFIPLKSSRYFSYSNSATLAHFNSCYFALKFRTEQTYVTDVLCRKRGLRTVQPFCLYIYTQQCISVCMCVCMPKQNKNCKNNSNRALSGKYFVQNCENIWVFCAFHQQHREQQQQQQQQHTQCHRAKYFTARRLLFVHVCDEL